MVVPALIGAGASLLGGIFSSRSAKKATARQNEYNDPKNIRARAEAAGFNPLLWAGQGNIQLQPTASGHMGNAIAKAGLVAADAMSEKRRLDLEKSRLEMDRERLDNLLAKQTIRPKVGGIYAAHQQTPSIKKTGAPLLSGAAAAQAVGAMVAPNRDVERDPVVDSSGVSIIENAATHGPVVVPGNDGDPWGIDELATAVVVGGPQVVYNTFKTAWQQWKDQTEQRQQARSVFFPEKKRKAPVTGSRKMSQREFMRRNYPTVYD